MSRRFRGTQGRCSNPTVYFRLKVRTVDEGSGETEGRTNVTKVYVFWVELSTRKTCGTTGTVGTSVFVFETG